MYHHKTYGILRGQIIKGQSVLHANNCCYSEIPDVESIAYLLKTCKHELFLFSTLCVDRLVGANQIHLTRTITLLLVLCRHE